MYWTEFLTVALIHLLAVASPGPDFAVVLKESVAHGRRAGLFTAWGVGQGIRQTLACAWSGLTPSGVLCGSSAAYHTPPRAASPAPRPLVCALWRRLCAREARPVQPRAG